MATFVCEVVKIDALEQIPGADFIELAVVSDYRSIVKKGQFSAGELVVYIPEGAIVPEKILEEMNLVGKLAGSQKNRVKGIRLRGYISDGLCYPNKGWELGQDVKEILEIKKYDPSEVLSSAGVPMFSRLKKKGPLAEYGFKYDVEDMRKYKTCFDEGEEVIATEKVHGSCFVCGHIPEMNTTFLSSKGHFANGIEIDYENPEMEQNLWVQAFKKYNLKEVVEKLSREFSDVVYFFGEAYGNQDMKYGLSGGAADFRAFGIRIGKKWLDFDDVMKICAENNVPVVPVLYRGPYSFDKIKEIASGNETLTGKEVHLREGVVVYPERERFHPRLGRLFLKFVSGEYRTRKGTATEFE